MLTAWLTRLAKIRRATTPEERERIYRFRYDVYVEELARKIGSVDHARRMVCDDDDEKDYAVHFYVGARGRIDGALRLCFWGPGMVPATHFEKLSLEIFPGINELCVAELGRLMIHPGLRGRLVLPSLMRAAYIFAVEEKGTDMVFFYCRPGLVKYYRKLGARPYPGKLVEEPEGMEVPLVSILSDLTSFQETGSPMAPLVRKYFGPGKRTPLDLSPYGKLFDHRVSVVKTEAGQVWEALHQDILQAEKGRGSILDSLSKRAIKSLAAKGLILDVPAGTLITREGHMEKELYFVVDGTFEVFSGKRRLELMSKGDLFGKVAAARRQCGL